MELKVGVVGLGRGRVYLDRFSKQDQAGVVAVWQIRPDWKQQIIRSMRQDTRIMRNF